MIRAALLLAIGVPSLSWAAHLITDPLAGTPLPTHCGFSIDGGVDVVVAVTPAASIPVPNTPPAGTVVCYSDISTLALGAHTAKVDAQYIDPAGVFPTTISAYSNVVNFTVPGVPGVPVNERVIK